MLYKNFYYILYNLKFLELEYNQYIDSFSINNLENNNFFESEENRIQYLKFSEKRIKLLKRKEELSLSRLEEIVEALTYKRLSFRR